MAEVYSGAHDADPKGQPAEQVPEQARIHNPYRSLLLLRYTLLNVVAFVLLGIAWSQGYVHKVVHADQTYLSVAIQWT